jgi:hypothetical protein
MAEVTLVTRRRERETAGGAIQMASIFIRNPLVFQTAQGVQGK